jgi:lipoprotein-anchoring transpeptidase ErfK/SrfK
MLKKTILRKASKHFNRILGYVPDKFLFVDTSKQKMYLISENNIFKQYDVSTSKFGIGNKENSLKTPRGLHRIKEKYGHGAPAGRIFIDRIDTGQNWPLTKVGNAVLTRILRLEGCEDGINRGKGIDSYERYIYIHGSANEASIGTPASNGCICMRNNEIIELFDIIPEGTFVYID